jgi:hypothetical protein
MKNTELCCTLDHYWDVNGRLIGSMTVREWGLIVGFHGHTITIDRISPILAIEESERTRHELLSPALSKRRAYICPRLDSSSPGLFSGKRITDECPDYAFSKIQEQMTYIPCSFGRPCHQLRPGECIIWSQCPKPDCFTRYCPRRICTAEIHGIVLEASCDLSGCPTDPAWQAQMERKRANTKAEGDKVNMPKCSPECVLARYSSFITS